jgi:hypothetical protein
MPEKKSRSTTPKKDKAPEKPSSPKTSAPEKKSRSTKSLGRDPFAGMELPPEPKRARAAPKRTRVELKSLGRDPFENMEQLLAPEPELAVSAIDVLEVAPVVEWVEPPDKKAATRKPPRPQLPARSAGALKGKGVWLLYSHDVDLAIQMAVAIEATHIFCKTGHRGMFFVEAAQRVYERARQAGLTPLAWTSVCFDDPLAEAEVACKSLRIGYEGVVFDVQDETPERGVRAATMGQHLTKAGVKTSQLYYASFPNIWQHPNIPYKEMNKFCQGGFMSYCCPAFQRTPRTVVDKWCYGEYDRWNAEWEDMPPLYPVLTTYTDGCGEQQLGTQEFLEWAQALATYTPPFYSVYHAGVTSRELWPILAALGEGNPAPAAAPPKVEAVAAPPFAPQSAPPQPVEPAPAPQLAAVAPPQPTVVAPSPAVVAAPPPRRAEPVPTPGPRHHLTTINDTVWGICDRYSVTRDKFWEWNGHLWDEHGLPRDGAYMQEGWRVRVG